MHSGASFLGMIGDGPGMRAVYDLTRQIAPTSATVLVTGETGTGKELVARAVHELSSRASGPFVRVNCGALNESLLESELFGHVKGAFTSAVENRTGRFEAAHTGTIFLDEINSVSHKLQVKLLRVLQEQEFERVGDTRTNKIDCRIVAATNRELLDEIDAGRFREDLYYRLNVLPIDIPPLRERREDLAELTSFFAAQYADRNRKPIPSISDEVLEIFDAYDWPGNVRELQNYVERAVILCDGPAIGANLLPPHVRGLEPPRVAGGRNRSLDEETRAFVCRAIREVGEEGRLHDSIVGLAERELIAEVLRGTRGVQTKAATKLGINRNTLHKKIEEYHLDGVA
ncbi:MAG: sigma-54 dependent transcriptional regulator [Planctomycetota bacterium]